VVAYCDVVFGNWVKTSSQMRLHCVQDWTKLFSLQLRTTENCLRLPPTQFTPPTPTRRDSLVLSCRRCELGITLLPPPTKSCNTRPLFVIQSVMSAC